MNDSMSFAAAMSTDHDSLSAIRAACAEAQDRLGPPPDFALIFFSQHHSQQAQVLAEVSCDMLDTHRIVGCSAESIVGNSREVEMDPAVAVWLARIPQVELTALRLEFDAGDGGTINGWPAALESEWPSTSSMIVLADPFSFPADVLLARLKRDQPTCPIVGGMASGGHELGENRLLLGREVFDSGAVCFHLSGDLSIRTIVSQGCRPIGRHFVITRAERNVIVELGGIPAYRRLEEVFRELPTREQQMVQSGLHVGRVVNEYQDQFEQGDFLVRNVVGADPDEGSIAVADFIRAGQTVQFHVRDAETASAELKQMLSKIRDQPQANPLAGLLFTCNGRGTRLFPEADHDAANVRSILGEIPLAGFFAAGELGPIGGQNFVHGFTASIALFERQC